MLRVLHFRKKKGEEACQGRQEIVTNHEFRRMILQLFHYSMAYPLMSASPLIMIFLFHLEQHSHQICIYCIVRLPLLLNGAA